MDNNDDKEKNMSEEQPEDEYSDNDIPLWLQGLENDDLDEPKPLTPKEDVKDSWVPEIDESIEDLQIDDEEAIEPPAELVDPDVLDQPTDDQDIMENEPTEEIEINPLNSGKFAEDIGPSLDDLPSSEGFMDISGMEVSEPDNHEESIIDEELLIDGDLPEWLQEMISEQDKSQPGETEHEDFEDQGIVDEQEPEDVISDQEEIPSSDEAIAEKELDVDDALDQEEIFEVEDETSGEEESLTMPALPAYLDEIAVSIAEDATTPVVISNEDEPALPSSEEEPSIEDVQSIEEEDPSTEEEQVTEDEPGLEEEPSPEDDPGIAEPHLISIDEQLEHAKQLLDQGDFDQALPLFNKMLEESVHIDTLETLIKEATEENEKNNSAAWELLGDITLRQNKPAQAFETYTKAIKLLLLDDEVMDETR